MEKPASSPCIKACRIYRDTCTGCKRTLEDIKMWSKYSEEKRKTIMNNIKGKK